MLDTFLFEERIPVLNELRTQIICLINAKDKLLVSSIFFNILFQIRGVKEKWISSIHDLEQDVRFLYNSPQLLPNFNVLLEWSNGQLYIILFDGRNLSSPIQKRYIFLMVYFIRGHLFCPCGSSWNFERLVLRGKYIFLGQELVHHACLVLQTSCWTHAFRNNGIVIYDYLLRLVPISCKLLFRHFCDLHKFFE